MSVIKHFVLQQSPSVFPCSANVVSMIWIFSDIHFTEKCVPLLINIYECYELLRFILPGNDTLLFCSSISKESTALTWRSVSFYLSLCLLCNIRHTDYVYTRTLSFNKKTFYSHNHPSYVYSWYKSYAIILPLKSSIHYLL